jgi:hypothetical protein
MIDDKDVKKLIEAFGEVFPTKVDFESFKDEYKESFSDMQKSVDAYAVKADKYFQEHSMLSNKVDRHGKWIEKLSKTAKVKLEY